MRRDDVRWGSWAAVCALLVAALAGCGGSSSVVGFGTATVTAIAPDPIPSAVATPFTVTGSNFLSLAGTDATVRFTAVVGTPFGGGLSNTADVPGTINSNTEIVGTSPLAPGATFDATVTVIMPTGLSATSTTAIAHFLGGPPTAVNDSYDTVGNVQLVVDAASGVLDNDTPAGFVTVTSFDAVGTLGGAVAVAADGSFTYDPPVGVEGVDTFTYDINGGASTATVLVTITDSVWFIDATAAGGGDGTFANPFDSIAAFNVVQAAGGPTDPAVGDAIFLYRAGGASYTGEITLKDDQRLLGQGVDLVIGPTTLVPTTGANSVLQGGAGATVTLASGNTVRGLDIANTAGAGVLGLNFGVLTLDTVTIDTTGGSGISLVNGAGGAVIVDSATVNTGAVATDGIVLNNTPGTLTFANLHVTTGNGSGFVADNAGNLSVTGSTNTIDATGGAALDVVDTPLAPAGLTFVSLSSDGGTRGIRLSTTGLLGGLTVTGDGGALPNGSGGLIRNSTLHGIHLYGSWDPSIRQLDVDTTVGHGVFLDSVTNLTYEFGTITSAGAVNDRHGVAIYNLHGTSVIQDVILDNINEDGIEIRQDMLDVDPVDTITIQRVQFLAHTAAGFGEHGIDVQAMGTANLAVTIQDGCLFDLNVNGSLGVIASSVDTSTLALTIDDCDFEAADAFGSGSVQVVGATDSNLTCTINNNRFDDSPFTPVIVNCDDDAIVNATITNNTIDVADAGHNGFGISLRQDEDGTMTALVDSNAIDDTAFDVIHAVARDRTVGSPGLNVTISNNTSTTAPDVFGAGIFLDARDGNSLCANVFGNSVIGTHTLPGLDDDISLHQAAPSSFDVTQAAPTPAVDPAELDDANGGATIGVSGTVTWSQPPCPTPP